MSGVLLGVVLSVRNGWFYNIVLLLLLLLLLLLNFSLLSFSWETFTYPGKCNQQE